MRRTEINLTSNDYRKAKSGFIYFAKSVYQGKEVVKIGYTTNWDVQKRITELCREYNLNLKLWFYIPGDIRDEKAIHARYKNFNVKNYYHNGNHKKELFWFESKVVEYCNTQKNNKNVICLDDSHSYLGYDKVYKKHQVTADKWDQYTSEVEDIYNYYYQNKNTQQEDLADYKFMPKAFRAIGNLAERLSKKVTGLFSVEPDFSNHDVK